MIFPNALHKKRKPIRHTSTARDRQLREYRKEVSWWLSGISTCARCGAYVILDNRTCHHKYGKVGRLLCWEPGWRMVDLNCHRWITDHTTEARALGLIGPEGTWNDYARAVKHYEANL